MYSYGDEVPFCSSTMTEQQQRIIYETETALNSSSKLMVVAE